MSYKRKLAVRTWSGEVHFLPEERKYLRFSFPCPKCGKKNSFDVIGAITGVIHHREEDELPFWCITCKNRECKYYLSKIVERN